MYKMSLTKGEGMQQMIKSKYILDSDRVIFDTIFAVKSVDEILVEAR